jgi:hypothetical protein
MKKARYDRISTNYNQGHTVKSVKVSTHFSNESNGSMLICNVSMRTKVNLSFLFSKMQTVHVTKIVNLAPNYLPSTPQHDYRSTA